MIDDILDIRRRAGLTEAWAPGDDPDDMPDPQDEFRERVYALETQIEKQVYAICTKLGMDSERKVRVNIYPEDRTIETTIYVWDSEVTLGLLAELSKTGILTLETRVVSHQSKEGIGIYIQTDRPLSAQEITALQYPAQLG